MEKLPVDYCRCGIRLKIASNDLEIMSIRVQIVTDIMVRDILERDEMIRVVDEG